MLSPRWRKVIRELAHYKLRTTLIILSVTVGIFAIGFVVLLQQALLSNMTASYQAATPSSAILYADLFDEQLVQRVRQVAGVREVEGRRALTLRFRPAGAADAEWRRVRVFALADYQQIRVDRVTSDEGSWPPPRDQLLIERASRSYAGVAPGDSLTLQLPSGREQQLTVAGVAHDINQRAADVRGEAYGYLTFETLSALGEPAGYNSLHVIVDAAPAEVERRESVLQEVRHVLEADGKLVHALESPPTPGAHPDHDDVQAILIVLLVLGVAALLFSVFLIINTISFILAQQLRQIGVMKAIGGENGQLLRMYLAMVLCYSLTALALAVPLAIYAAGAFARYVAELINFDIVSSDYLVPGVLAQLLTGLLVPLGATLIPVLRGTGIPVREAIAAQGSGDRFGPGLLDRLLVGLRRFSPQISLALRNTFRRKGRLVLTLIPLVLGSTLFMAIMTLRESTYFTLNDQLARYGGFDVKVELEVPATLSSFQQATASLGEVARIEGWGAAPARRVRAQGREGNTFTLLGVPPATTILNPGLIAGRWLAPGDERALVINTMMLKIEPDLQVGSEMVLTVNRKQETWQVVGITNGPLGDLVSYASYDYFARSIGQPDQVNVVNVVTSQHDPLAQSETGKRLEGALGPADLKVASTETAWSVRDRVTSELEPIIIFLSLMAVLLALIGAIGLVGTMSTNILERTREIGVLRAIGADNRALRKIMLVEGLVVGLLSWFVGLWLSLPLGQLLSDEVGQAIAQAPLSYQLSWLGGVLWLGIVVVLTVLATLLPARRALRVTTRQALAYE